MIEWRDSAACRGLPLGQRIGFVGNSYRHHMELAESICSTCEVRGKCLLFGLESREVGLYAIPRHFRDRIAKDLEIDQVDNGLHKLSSLRKSA